MTNEPQYIIEGIILRRLHEKRIEGYTIETAKEIADSLALRSEVHTREALANQLEDWAFWGELDNYLKDDFLDDIERIYAGAAQASWMPIETAPKDRKRILLYQEGRGAFEGWWHTAWPHPEEYWMDDADSEPSPTHWRPTLAPPSADRA